MKKSISIILTLLYLFTAQLTVHAFAMHWWSHWTHNNNHTEKQHHCWSTTNDKEDTHDMSLCLEQSMWAFVEYVPYIIDSGTDYLHQTDYKFSIDKTAEQLYTYSLHDPWWGDDWNFPRYLDQLYGHGIIMHC